MSDLAPPSASAEPEVRPATPPTAEAASLEALERRMLRTRIARDWVQIAVFIVAAPWAVYTFWYQAQAVREKEQPSLVLTAHLEVLERRADAVAVRGSLQARNLGKARARLGAQVLNLTGGRFDPEALRAGPTWSPDGGPPTGHRWAVVPGLAGERTALASTGEEVLGVTSLEPGDEYEETRVFLVPPDRFDFLELHWRAYYTADGRGLDGCWEREVTPQGVRLRRRDENDPRCDHGTSEVTTQAVLGADRARGQ